MCTHTVSAGEHPTFESSHVSHVVYQVLEGDTSGASTSLVEMHSNDNGTILDDDLRLYVLSTSRRTINGEIEGKVDFSPEYSLLVAFQVPQLLEIANQPQILTSPQLHWTSRAISPASRISGWKEANTLYSQRRPHLS